MTVIAILLFVAAAFIGSYVQSVAGFAMGLLVIAIMGAAGVMSLPMVAAAVSLISLVNVVLSLRGRMIHLHRPLFGWIVAGQVLAIAPGLWLVTLLDATAERALGVLLGLFVTCGALGMLLRPHPRGSVSKPASSFVAGVAGGLLAGMFAASGPVLGWFGYRQPLPLDVIRATLLCCFGVSTSLRTVLVGFSGGLTPDVMLLAGLALPAVLLGTWLGRNLPPPWSEAGIKKAAFTLLLLAGMWTLARSLIF
jgi:uncharacterized membrane protein YfcA